MKSVNAVGQCTRRPERVIRGRAEGFEGGSDGLELGGEVVSEA